MGKMSGKNLIIFIVVLAACLGLVAWGFSVFKSNVLGSERKKGEEETEEIKVKVEEEEEAPEEEEEEWIFDLRQRDIDELMRDLKDARNSYEKAYDRAMRQMEEMEKQIREKFERDFYDFKRWPDWGFPRFYRDFDKDFWDLRPFWRHRLSVPEEETFYMKMDVEETDDKIVIKCDLPGMDKEKIDISLKGRVLTIKGKREVRKEIKDEKGRVVKKERSFGAFTRSFTLPENIKPDEITSEYKDGVLTIVVPKEKEKEEKEIKIKVYHP